MEVIESQGQAEYAERTLDRFTGLNRKVRPAEFGPDVFANKWNWCGVSEWNREATTQCQHLDQRLLAAILEADPGVSDTLDDAFIADCLKKFRRKYLNLRTDRCKYYPDPGCLEFELCIRAHGESNMRTREQNLADVAEAEGIFKALLTTRIQQIQARGKDTSKWLQGEQDAPMLTSKWDYGPPTLSTEGGSSSSSSGLGQIPRVPIGGKKDCWVQPKTLEGKRRAWGRRTRNIPIEKRHLGKKEYRICPVLGPVTLDQLLITCNEFSLLRKKTSHS